MTITLVPGTTYVVIITSAQERSRHCPSVALTQSVQASVAHIVIKQEYDALELQKMHVQLETYNSLEEVMIMKEF